MEGEEKGLVGGRKERKHFVGERDWKGRRFEELNRIENWEIWSDLQAAAIAVVE